MISQQVQLHSNVLLYSKVRINAVSVIRHSQHFFLQSSKQAGFSLIELVMVIVIVGVLSITAMPKFFNTLSFSSVNYFNEVLNSIRYAQKLAVVMGCDVQVTINNNGLALLARKNCLTGDFTTTINDPVTGSSFIKTAPINVGVTNTGFPIYFDRVGRARQLTGQAANAMVTIAGRNIKIVAETGLVYEP